jgi:hypothetical protein
MAATRDLLDPAQIRSAAAHTRALALRGAESVLDGGSPEAQLRRRLVERYGVVPARRDLTSIGPPPGEVDADDPTPASDALRWVRGEE